MIRLIDGAVATSGNYEIYFDREKTFHHIVDPQSGRCPFNEQSVTTICRSTVMADALSTAVFVMEADRSIALFNKLPGVEGMVISRNGEKHFSSGWKHLTA
jgi:thiamine biosynthesis lipoprotein